MTPPFAESDTSLVKSVFVKAASEHSFACLQQVKNGLSLHWLHSWGCSLKVGGPKLLSTGQSDHFNTSPQILNAAVAGLGLAYVPEGLVERYLAKGRRQSSAAFALLVEALRHRP
jgi:DNA-binding transcriptional LysR family regulator